MKHDQAITKKQLVILGIKILRWNKVYSRFEQQNKYDTIIN